MTTEATPFPPVNEEAAAFASRLAVAIERAFDATKAR
jgi:hypothetical protein